MPDPHRQALAALRAGDWHAAHKLVQSLHDPLACWIHAHLHRIEGDLDNAGYWYRRAGREASQLPLDRELAELDAALGAD